MTGRPRDHDLERRLLEAGWSLLVEGGYDALTLSQVATCAYAHRSDVYRRWATKAQLVTAVVEKYLPPAADIDTGTLLGDLRAFLDDLAAAWAAPWAEGLVGLLADLRHDREAEASFTQMSQRRSQPLSDLIARAVRRGEIIDMPEPALVGNLLEGPLMHRQMFGRRAASTADLDVIARSTHALLTGSLVSR